jgi:hypothetical protein
MSTLMLMTVAAGEQSGCTRDVTLLPLTRPVDGGHKSDGKTDTKTDTKTDSGGTSGIDSAVLPIDSGGVRPPDGGGLGLSCSGLGAPIQLPTAAGDLCAGVLASRAHRFALCTCADLGVIAPITLDVFDSTMGTVSGQKAAAVGVNGDLQAVAPIRAAGALYVAGAEGVTTSATLTTAASFRVAGSTHVTSSSVDVATDAYLGSDVSGSLAVHGTLHLAPAAITTQAIIAAGATVREPVAVPPPCDCAPGFVDLPAAIAATAKHNDNVAAGLTIDRLGAVGTSSALDLSCGHYIVSAIDAQQTVFLAVHGRALLAVSGDVLLRGGLTVSLDPGAELDLLVGGRFETSGPSPIGATSPARFRIWVASSELVGLFDGPSVRAMLYAPSAVVVAPDGLELSGGLFAQSLVAGEVGLHFDQAVFSAGASCGEAAVHAVP